MREAPSTSPGITWPRGKFGRPCQVLAKAAFRAGKGDIHLQISHGDLRSKGACARGAATGCAGCGLGTCRFGRTGSSRRHHGAEPRFSAAYHGRLGRWRGYSPRWFVFLSTRRAQRSHEAQVLALHGATWSWAVDSGREAARETAAEEERGRGATNQPLGGTS